MLLLCHLPATAAQNSWASFLHPVVSHKEAQGATINVTKQKVQFIKKNNLILTYEILCNCSLWLYACITLFGFSKLQLECVNTAVLEIIDTHHAMHWYCVCGLAAYSVDDVR